MPLKKKSKDIVRKLWKFNFLVQWKWGFILDKCEDK